MKGIEGLPLKYIAIILAAALIIAVVVTVVNNFTKQATEGSEDLSKTTEVGLSEANQEACKGMNACWNKTSGACQSNPADKENCEEV